MKQIKDAIFNNVDYNQIVSTWLYLSIDRRFKSLYDIKTAIKEAYIKCGISYEQEQASLMALGLDNELEPNKTMLSKAEILELINKAYSEHLINELDYFIALNYGAYKRIISSYKVKNQLEINNINYNLIDAITLKAIINELDTM